MALSDNKIKIQSLIDEINALPEAITLDELTNPGSAATMLEGTEMLDGEGKKVTGTIETKTSSDLTASGATVNVPAGYYAENASKSIQSATVEPSFMHVDEGGLVTATFPITSSGYIAAETKILETQLAVQEAKAVTPTKASQTAVDKGYYTTGAVTVAPIPAKYQDVSGVTSTAATTLAGSKFVSSSGKLTSGTMPDNGAISSTMDGLETKSVSIPAGYTSGGTVALDSTIDNTANSQATQIDEIMELLDGKAAGGGGSVETCTVNVSVSKHEDSDSTVRFASKTGNDVIISYINDEGVLSLVGNPGIWGFSQSDNTVFSTITARCGSVLTFSSSNFLDGIHSVECSESISQCVLLTGSQGTPEAVSFLLPDTAGDYSIVVYH